MNRPMSIPQDTEELPEPQLNEAETESDDSTDAVGVGWRIEWNPHFAREA